MDMKNLFQRLKEKQFDGIELSALDIQKILNILQTSQRLANCRSTSSLVEKQKDVSKALESIGFEMDEF